MLPGQILPGQMSPWQLESLLDVSRNLPVKFHQNRVSNSWDIPIPILSQVEKGTKTLSNVQSFSKLNTSNLSLVNIRKISYQEISLRFRKNSYKFNVYLYCFIFIYALSPDFSTSSLPNVSSDSIMAQTPTPKSANIIILWMLPNMSFICTDKWPESMFMLTRE